MPGETEKDVSAWTTDSLRYALKEEIEALRVYNAAQVDALGRETREGQHAQDDRLDERYDTQMKALEAAFVAAEKAVNAALETTEKAILKAETATDKRFDSVNEFRGQLADQANMFMPRSESTTRWQAVSEKLDAYTVTTNERFSKIELRLESTVSTQKGGESQSERMLAGVALLVSMLSVAIAMFVALR